MAGLGWERVDYDSLNAKQQEAYNFQKVSAVLADYGFNCIKLTDDWNGADFLACHMPSDDWIDFQGAASISPLDRYS